VCVGGDLTLGPMPRSAARSLSWRRNEEGSVRDLHSQVQQVRLPVIRPVFAWVRSALLSPVAFL